MILRILKYYNPFHFILIFLIISSFWTLNYFITPEITFSNDNLMPFYQLIISKLKMLENKFLLFLINFLIIFFQSFLIVLLDLKYSFSGNRNFLSGIIYSLLISLVSFTNLFSPSLFSFFFVYIAFNRLFAAYNKDNILSNIFDASFFITIGALFYFQTIFLLLVVFIAAFMFKSSPIKEWLVICVAIFTVAIIYCELYFVIFGEIKTILSTIKNAFIYSYKIDIQNIRIIIYLSLLFIFGFISITYFFKTSATLNVNLRIYLIALLISTAILAINYTLSKLTDLNSLLLIIFPLSYFISQFYNNSKLKEKKLNILFLLFCFSIVFVNIYPFLF